MCRRSQEPARGQWMVPSGFLECGETLEEGAAREMLEETGVRIDPRELELHSLVNMTAIEQVAVCFRTTLTAKPAIRCGAECLEAEFMTWEEIPFAQFAWRASIGDGLQLLFDEVRSGSFNIHLMSIGSSQGTGFKSRDYEVSAVVKPGMPKLGPGE